MVWIVQLVRCHGTVSIWRIKVKKNEVSGVYRVQWMKGEEYTGFWWGNPRERAHWGDPGIGGKIILRWIFRR
jgi:hypothetical protein